MSAKSEVCRRKEITLSQYKLGESPRMEESRRESCHGKKGKAPGAGGSIYIYIGWGEFGFNSWGIRGARLVLFLFHVNVSEMHPRSRLSSQPLTIPTPWVLLHVGWSIPLVLPWVTASRFLVGNREAELKHHFLFTPTFLYFPVFPLLPTPK